MGDGLSAVVSTMLAGFVTGAMAFAVCFAWLKRRLGDPALQGRRAALTIVVGAALVVVFGLWLIVSPWLSLR